jgi:branched-chain amino acid transport system substrate-binding protein
MSPRTVLFCCGLIAAALFLASCSGGDDEPITIKVGIVQSLSGEGWPYGTSAVEGMELAIEELNRAGDVQIEYVIVDDKSTVEGGLAAYQSLKAQDVDVIVGPTYSTIGRQVLKYANDNAIPAIAPITTGTGLAAIGDYVFRIALAEEVSLPELVERVSRDSKITRAAMVFDSRDDYSRSAAEAFRKGVSMVGGNVACEVDLAQPANQPPVLRDPCITGADAVLLPLLLNQTTADVLKELQAAGVTKPKLGGEAITTTDLVGLAGDATNGLIVASSWHSSVTDQRSQDFVSAYRAKFNRDPEHFAAESHAAMYVLADATGRAGSADPAALQKALAATKDLDTVLGRLSMDADGDAVFEPVFQRFEGGRLVILK